METGDIKAIYQAGIKTGQDLILKNANMAEILGQAKQEGRKEVVKFVEKHIPKSLENFVGFWQEWLEQKKEWGLEYGITESGEDS